VIFRRCPPRFSHPPGSIFCALIWFPIGRFDSGTPPRAGFRFLLVIPSWGRFPGPIWRVEGFPVPNPLGFLTILLSLLFRLGKSFSLPSSDQVFFVLEPLSAVASRTLPFPPCSSLNGFCMCTDNSFKGSLSAALGAF